MPDFATDPTYLAYQYGTSEKLRIRQEAHEHYSERPNDFFVWALDLLDLHPGQLVADVGCGPGAYHALVAAAGCTAIGIDASFGMMRDVAAQAAEQRLAVWPVQASAERLPLADSSVDRLMANHMLYHVPDQEAALAEMRRVLKPGGRVMLATNAEDANDVFHNAHSAAAQSLGYVPTPRMSSRFHLGHLELVQRFFPGAEVHVREDAFRFPTLDAALRYYASGTVDAIEHAPRDGSHTARLLPLVEAHLRGQMDAGGSLRVPKAAGCFVAIKQ
ncbi:MAG TPA: class I SAM-dependent methyltransferase [Caldilinea sp.]|nr:class I SAM-dependent methyltransferase [Caldilinea sp.]